MEGWRGGGWMDGWRDGGMDGGVDFISVLLISDWISVQDLVSGDLQPAPLQTGAPPTHTHGYKWGKWMDVERQK